MTDVWREGDFRQRKGESADERQVRLTGRAPSALTLQTQERPKAEEGNLADYAERAGLSLPARQSRMSPPVSAPDSEALRRCKSAIRALTVEDKARLAVWFGDGMRS